MLSAIYHRKGMAVIVSHLYAIILRVTGWGVFIIFCEVDPFLREGVTIIGNLFRKLGLVKDENLDR